MCEQQEIFRGMVDHVEEMSLRSRRESQGVQVVMSETAGRRREEEEKMRGDWNQKVKRRRWKPKVVSNGVEGVHEDPSVKDALRGSK